MTIQLAHFHLHVQLVVGRIQVLTHDLVHRLSRPAALETMRPLMTETTPSGTEAQTQVLTGRGHHPMRDQEGLRPPQEQHLPPHMVQGVNTPEAPILGTTGDIVTWLHRVVTECERLALLTSVIDAHHK